jgi:hypothetical protein
MGEPQRITGLERRLARRQLKPLGAQRIQVCALIHRPTGTSGLLRGEMSQGPDNLGVGGELRADFGQ